MVHVALVLFASTVADAQTLASRVAGVDDGTVRMEVPSRPGVCGDGRETVGFRNALFSRNFQSIGRWSGVNCRPGPLRVTLTVDNGHVTRMRLQVGGVWPSADGPVTDLGLVSPIEGSAYFFTLVPQLEGSSGKDRLLLPAVLADDAPVIQPLLALAHDEDRNLHTRQHAVQWLGILGDASVLPALMQLARDAGDRLAGRVHDPPGDRPDWRGSEDDVGDRSAAGERDKRAGACALVCSRWQVGFGENDVAVKDDLERIPALRQIGKPETALRISHR